MATLKLKYICRRVSENRFWVDFLFSPSFKQIFKQFSHWYIPYSNHVETTTHAHTQPGLTDSVIYSAGLGDLPFIALALNNSLINPFHNALICSPGKNTALYSMILSYIHISTSSSLVTATQHRYMAGNMAMLLSSTNEGSHTDVKTFELHIWILSYCFENVVAIQTITDSRNQHLEMVGKLYKEIVDERHWLICCRRGFIT